MSEKWYNSLGSMVTKRNSVMTPLLVLNALIVIGGIIVYIPTQNFILFIFEAIILIFTLYKYERFSKEQPWMLSSSSIQKYGMQLTLGDSTKGIEKTSTIDGETIQNPQSTKKRITAPVKKENEK